jgi:amidase
MNFEMVTRREFLAGVAVLVAHRDEARAATLTPFSSATEIAAAISTGATTSRTICEAYLDRIMAKNWLISAIATVRSAQAIFVEADASDQRWAADAPLSPLDGVPFTLKSQFSTLGVRTTNGGYGVDFPSPASDGDIAKRLKDAGLILIGKTNGPGEAYRTRTPVFGETTNPFNTAYAVGGSSGGSAAAVAAGLTGFDIGSDSAGSIRIPASFCGVYGFKPTNGVVSDNGDWGVSPPSRPPFLHLDFCSYGPLTRKIEDISPIMQIIAGRTPARPAIPDLRANGKTPSQVQKLVKVDHIGRVWNLSPDEQAALDKACADLAKAGVTIEHRPIPWFDEAVSLRIYGGLSDDASALAASYPINETQWTASGLNYAKIMAATSQARVHIVWLQQQIEAMMDDADGLILATTALPPPPIGPTKLNPIPFMAFTSIFSLTGHPAISMPLGVRAATGVPFGLQIVGRHWRDYELLQIAAQVNDHLPGFMAPAI